MREGGEGRTWHAGPRPHPVALPARLVRRQQQRDAACAPGKRGSAPLPPPPPLHRSACASSTPASGSRTKTWQPTLAGGGTGAAAVLCHTCLCSTKQAQAGLSCLEGRCLAGAAWLACCVLCWLAPRPVPPPPHPPPHPPPPPTHPPPPTTTHPPTTIPPPHHTPPTTLACSGCSVCDGSDTPSSGDAAYSDLIGVFFLGGGGGGKGGCVK